MSYNNQNINNNDVVNINENIIGNKKIVNVTKNITKQPKRLSSDEINKLKKITQRPYLKHRLGERISCYGYIIGRYKNTDLYTVINLVDNNGKYITDHVQLNLKTNEYDYHGNNITFIKFKGVVKEYTRKSNNTIDYEIDLIEKPVILTETYYNMRTNNVDYYSKEINESKIFDYISTIEISKLYELINKLKQIINNLTSYDFGENFIYSFIINQYMLNTATYELYNENINTININEDAVLQILILISSIVYILYEADNVSLTYILEFICYVCNIFQGVRYSNESNPTFRKFCEQKLNIKSKSKMKNAWKTVHLRKMNFGSDPNPNDFKFDEVINMAYSVLGDFII